MNRRGFIRGMIGLCVMAAVPFTWTARKVRKVFTGARARVFINGKEVFYAQNVSWSIVDKQTLEPIDVLGKYEPTELFEPIIAVRMSKVNEDAVRKLAGGNDDTV
jgi:hypothetical protein